jgi:hypothetical protein
MDKVSFDSFDERIKLYESAVEDLSYYEQEFEQAYRFSFPNRNRWYMRDSKTFITDKSSHHWDSTAIEGNQQFASNMQTLLMPMSQDWFSFKPGYDFAYAANNLLIKQALDRQSETVLQYLRSSNLNLEANLAIQDCGISTGLLQIHIDPKNKTSPLSFEAIPMYQVAIGEYKGRIENVWRKFKIKAKDITNYWPKAELNKALSDKVKESPNEDVELIEGTVYYPSNPDKQKYLYTVSHVDTKFDVVFEERSWSPWIPFRFNLSSGETWGCGPVRSGLSAIRMANMLVELEMTHVSYNVQMPMLHDASKILNPRTMKLSPGAFISVQDVQTPPLVPFQVTGDLKFSQMALSEIQQHIRDMLFADPIGPVGNDQTATEVQVRQQNAIKRNNAAFSRMENELIFPIIKKASELLAMHDLLPSFEVGSSGIEFKLDGRNIDIHLSSPLRNMQEQEEVQAIQSYYQTLGGILGQAGVLGGTNIAKLPQLLAEKMNIPLELAKSEAEVAQIVQQLTQPQQQPPPPPGQPQQGAPAAQQQAQQQLGQMLQPQQ